MPERVNKNIHDPLGDPMVLEQSRRRYKTGRRIMLVCAALFALSRALYFLPNGDYNSEITPAITLLTAMLPIWFWVVAWSVVVALCLRDLFRPAGRSGIAWLVAMMFAWATAYLISYVGSVVVEGFGSREWYTFATYAFGGGVIFGLIMKVGALKRRGEDV